MAHRSMIALGLTVSAAFIGSGAQADTIALKSSTRLPAGARIITLAHVAEIEGASAMQFADLPVAELKNGALLEISIREIRDKLDAAGAHWGNINLSGKVVIVRTAPASQQALPMAMTPVEIAPADNEPSRRTSTRDEYLASETAPQANLRGVITNLVLTNLHLQAADLRLGFDHSDAPLLNGSVQSTRFEVQPLTSFSSDRIDFTVRTWIDGKVQDSQYVSVFPAMRTKAATLRRDIHANQSIGQDDLVPTELWLPPTQAGMTANPISAIGRVAAKNMKAGETLREKNLRRDAAIKRGDLVIVRCLVGGVVISVQAEARADGAEGELIEFRKQGERETFLATVSKRGEAILDLSQRS